MVFGELKLGFLVLDVDSKPDSIKVDATALVVKRSLKRCLQLGCQLRTDEFGHRDRHPLLSCQRGLRTITRAAKLALENHLKGTALGVGVVLLGSCLAGLSAQLKELLQRVDLTLAQASVFAIIITACKCEFCCHGNGLYPQQPKRVPIRPARGTEWGAGAAGRGCRGSRLCCQE